MKKIFVVALGGALGSLLRYLTFSNDDEIALFFLNMLGVAIAGFIAFRLATSELIRLALIPGFAAGLTTFSSIAVFHAKSSSLGNIAYFFASVLVSIAILFVIKPRART